MDKGRIKFNWDGDRRREPPIERTIHVTQTRYVVDEIELLVPRALSETMIQDLNKRMEQLVAEAFYGPAPRPPLEFVTRLDEKTKQSRTGWWPIVWDNVS